MRISDWSSDVCSSDLFEQANGCNDVGLSPRIGRGLCGLEGSSESAGRCRQRVAEHELSIAAKLHGGAEAMAGLTGEIFEIAPEGGGCRSEEHTSELQSLMRISYAVVCLKKKTKETKC